MLDLQADYTIADLCDTQNNWTSPWFSGHGHTRTGIHLLARPNHFAQADQITAAHCASVLSSCNDVRVRGRRRPCPFDPGGLAVLDLADINIFVMQLL
jgi:hypothetical protein